MTLGCSRRGHPPAMYTLTRLLEEDSRFRSCGTLLVCDYGMALGTRELHDGSVDSISLSSLHLPFIEKDGEILGGTVA